VLKAGALQIPTSGAPFERVTIERRDPGPHDVLIRIHFVGICHSDVHMVLNEWGETVYPLVPGHEIAGVIDAVGTEVTRFDLGDRVGVGCFVDSCRVCRNCRAGQQQFCVEGETETYNSVDKSGKRTQGGYSSHIVVDENYVLRIPDSLGLDTAAPLMCAGISMYSPCRRWRVGSGTRVAVVGLGGLGHVGVQVARALGAEVTLISHSSDKVADAARFGAAHFFVVKEPDDLRTLTNSFDVILNTASSNVSTDLYLSLLDVDGVLVTVGLPVGPLSVSSMFLIQNQRVIAGTKNGGIGETQAMLDFCAAHGIAAEVETLEAGQVDTAYRRLLAGDVRYRFVLHTSGLYLS
jgi:alcohol dehydrogenase (NADP+)